MESEEINSKPIDNNEEEEIEEEQENEEGQENEKEENENNLNLLVKEEKVEKNEPVQEIKMAEDKPEEKEEEEEKEGKEEEEIEVEEEVEEENEAQNEPQKEGENEGETELKIKKSDEDDEEHLEEENNIKEDKESPNEEPGDKDNQEASKGSEENADEEHEQSEEEKEEILRIENSDAKKSTQEYNLKGIEVSATYYEDKDNMNIVFKKSSSSPNLILHWGLIKEYPANGWHHPDKENYPRNTKEFDAFALQTEFADDEKESTIELELPKNDAKGISFVFYNPVTNEWHNNNWRDFQIFFN